MRKMEVCLNVWTCNSFLGCYPVGTAAVIVADTREEAVKILETHLTHMGLRQSISENQILPVLTDEPHAIILCDGDF